ncbi:3-galactosyl-N-acetylglucosaminide 4-alpha-L-fucosyltransferase FUT3-like [Pelobates fuscus]|uniref:3-galactosyl-N-acetylglucosaminide 4-alpha-L-fucosyltransferase FUT3-like n=1 Tax=Pelobates fuscus TaxID=191477 RepID=UPI002FE4DAED
MAWKILFCHRTTSFIFLTTFMLLIVMFISLTWMKFDTLSKVIKCKQAEVIYKTVGQQNMTVSSNTKDILVLVWVWPFGTHFPLDTCRIASGISGCKMTADRSQYSVADAVVMHHVDIMYDQKSLPQEPRPHNQHWVWFNMEPPLIIKNLHFLDNLFNLTMTFRQDSDIYRPYGRIVVLKEPRKLTIPAKSKLVSWVVSQWYPGVARTAYYEELRKYIPIDVYGKKNMTLSWNDFFKTISQYKFYLAFENSNYKDYITEKFWSNAYDSWAVPVVLGTSRTNYERFIPRDAFIHVDDFPSAKELAAYLLELDKDEERYKKYFNWRTHYQVIRDPGWERNYCQVCAALRKAPYYQTIPSIAKWFLENVEVSNTEN